MTVFEDELENKRKFRAKETSSLSDLKTKKAKKNKQAKYLSQKTDSGGIKFDSKKEAARWQELVLGQKLGWLKGLKRQVWFPLLVNGQKVCSFVADFSYEVLRPIPVKLVVEDVKSEFTRKLPVYRIKKKLMKACHGIEIKEA